MYYMCESNCCYTCLALGCPNNQIFDPINQSNLVHIIYKRFCSWWYGHIKWLPTLTDVHIKWNPLYKLSPWCCTFLIRAEWLDIAQCNIKYRYLNFSICNDIRAVMVNLCACYFERFDKKLSMKEQSMSWPWLLTNHVKFLFPSNKILDFKNFPKNSHVGNHLPKTMVLLYK